MTTQRVLYYPHSALRKEASPVEADDEAVFSLIQDLKDTCLAYQADGLAATQIGVAKRVFVTNINGDMKVYINPHLHAEGDTVINREGCISFPTTFLDVPRHEEATIVYTDEEGEEKTFSLDGHEAVAVQHEYDHLEGIVMTDRVKPVARHMALKKLAKLLRQHTPKKAVAKPSSRAAARKERKRLKKAA